MRTLSSIWLLVLRHQTQKSSTPITSPSHQLPNYLAGRLEPGKIFLVDLKEKRVVQDAELKQKLAEANKYQDWLAEQQITWKNLGIKSYEVSIAIAYLQFQ